ncbi:hypothetical protein T439DRAFT_376056 [Meredithblackwellia eburnea MCA 4105]
MQYLPPPPPPSKPVAIFWDLVTLPLPSSPPFEADVDDPFASQTQSSRPQALPMPLLTSSLLKFAESFGHGHQLHAFRAYCGGFEALQPHTQEQIKQSLHAAGASLTTYQLLMVDLFSFVLDMTSWSPTAVVIVVIPNPSALSYCVSMLGQRNRNVIVVSERTDNALLPPGVFDWWNIIDPQKKYDTRFPGPWMDLGPPPAIQVQHPTPIKEGTLPIHNLPPHQGTNGFLTPSFSPSARVSGYTAAPPSVGLGAPAFPSSFPSSFPSVLYGTSAGSPPRTSLPSIAEAYREDETPGHSPIISSPHPAFSSNSPPETPKASSRTSSTSSGGNGHLRVTTPTERVTKSLGSLALATPPNEEEDYEDTPTEAFEDPVGERTVSDDEEQRRSTSHERTASTDSRDSQAESTTSSDRPKVPAQLHTSYAATLKQLSTDTSTGKPALDGTFSANGVYKPAPLNKSSTPTPVPPRFQPLLTAILKFGGGRGAEIERGLVGTELVRSTAGKGIYSTLGFESFSDYSHQAEKEGIISLKLKGPGVSVLKLTKKYYRLSAAKA